MRQKLLFWGQKLIAERDLWFLAPLSWGWGLVSRCRNLFYDLHIFRTSRAACTVVSVGNVVAGGTGKTPFVHLLASHFPHRRVAILSRGYGPIPDEPRLLQRRLPHARIYVGKDRVSLAQRAVEEGAQLILLDDGFQYRKLHRDFDLVLHAKERQYYLPRGFLRDSPKRLKRADGVFAIGEELEVVSGRMLDLAGREIASIEKVGLFCGIARPERFKKTVTSLGIEIVDTWFFADHGVAKPRQLKNFAERCKTLGAKAILCTEKDAVKIPPTLKATLPIAFLEISLAVQRERKKWEKLIAKIDQTIDNFSYV